MRVQLNCRINTRITATLIRANRNEVAIGMLSRHVFLDCLQACVMLLIDQRHHSATDRSADIDRRENTLVCQLPG